MCFSSIDFFDRCIAGLMRDLGILVFDYLIPEENSDLLGGGEE
jgi:hypothetical protein